MILTLFQIYDRNYINSTTYRSLSSSKYLCSGNPYSLRLLIWTIVKYKKYNSFINNKVCINILTLKSILKDHSFISIKLLCDESKESVSFYYNKAFTFLTRNIIKNKKESSFTKQLNSKLEEVKLMCELNIRTHSKEAEIFNTHSELEYSQTSRNLIVKSICDILDN